ADLALRDDGLLARVHDLDGVLDREDVIGLRAVDQIDERRERRRLAVAARARDDHEALVVRDHLRELDREAELLERRRCGERETERALEAGLLLRDVRAQAAAIGSRQREVDIAEGVELRA